MYGKVVPPHSQSPLLLLLLLWITIFWVLRLNSNKIIINHYVLIVLLLLPRRRGGSAAYTDSLSPPLCWAVLMTTCWFLYFPSIAQQGLDHLSIALSVCTERRRFKELDLSMVPSVPCLCHFARLIDSQWIHWFFNNNPRSSGFLHFCLWSLKRWIGLD